MGYVKSEEEAETGTEAERRAACDESGDHSPVSGAVLGNHSYVPAIKRRLFPSCEDQLDGE